MEDSKKTNETQTITPSALAKVEPKKPTGRKCSVCTHEEAKKINSLINNGKSFRYISLHFGMSAMSVGRHTENCLKLDIAALVREKRIENAVEHYEEMRMLLEFSKELQQAAREWLLDPETGKITLTPRADEVTVVYLDYADLMPNLQPKKKKASLQSIIDNIQSVNANFSAQSSIIKTTDLRDYALKTIDSADKVLDKFARVDGHYQKEKENTDELTQLKKQIERRAESRGVSFEEEAALYLRLFGSDLKPEIKEELSTNLIN